MTTSTSAPPSATPPVALTNETLRQRILIGGSKPDAAPPRGTLAKAASRFRDVTAALRADDAPTVVDATAALRNDLALHDLEMRKLFLSARAYDAASSKSRASLSTMTSRQTSIQNDIESLTVELNHQKRIRRNREEYNTLAKMINVAHPAAAKTREDLKIVQEEIDRTKLEVERAQWEISVKERQVRAFMASLGDLREILRDEDWRKRGNEVLTKDDAADAGGVDTTQKDVESDGENKRMRLSDTEMDSDAAGAL
jgi:hypothetical protein